MSYFPPKDTFDEEHYFELINDKDIIIQFLIENNYINRRKEYPDFIEKLEIMYKLTE